MSEKELIKISFLMGEASNMIIQAICKLENLENETHNLMSLEDRKKMHDALGLVRSASDLFSIFTEDRG